jgi:ligand-binding sensor domain-containing protein
VLPAREGGLWLLSESSLLRWERTIRARYAPPEARRFRWLVEDSRGRLFAFGEGELERALYRLVAPSAGEQDKPTWQKVGIQDNRARYYDDLWLCGISDSIGHLWIGARSGLILGDGEGWWLSREGAVASASTVSPAAELVPPYGNIRCLAFAPNGDLWAGTPEGACRLREGKWNYFWGKRWLPDNHIHAIVIDPQNRAWIATNKGIACIESVRMTLREKAEYYEALIAQRHNRNGL